jgi:hypothetical protein
MQISALVCLQIRALSIAGVALQTVVQHFVLSDGFLFPVARHEVSKFSGLSIMARLLH